mmetsp:Transcript_20720/g.64814  ORF Transcript_20720/g.64814 Transcript_20720/m.64814 type:complete len:229 (-) Transcript_20720:56-742(-)
MGRGEAVRRPVRGRVLQPRRSGESPRKALRVGREHGARGVGVGEHRLAHARARRAGGPGPPEETERSIAESSPCAEDSPSGSRITAERKPLSVTRGTVSRLGALGPRLGLYGGRVRPDLRAALRREAAATALRGRAAPGLRRARLLAAARLAAVARPAERLRAGARVVPSGRVLERGDAGERGRASRWRGRCTLRRNWCRLAAARPASVSGQFGECREIPERAAVCVK